MGKKRAPVPRGALVQDRWGWRDASTGLWASAPRHPRKRSRYYRLWALQPWAIRTFFPGISVKSVRKR